MVHGNMDRQAGGAIVTKLSLQAPFASAKRAMQAVNTLAVQLVEEKQGADTIWRGLWPRLSGAVRQDRWHPREQIS